MPATPRLRHAGFVPGRAPGSAGRSDAAPTPGLPLRGLYPAAAREGGGPEGPAPEEPPSQAGRDDGGAGVARTAHRAEDGLGRLVLGALRAPEALSASRVAVGCTRPVMRHRAAGEPQDEAVPGVVVGDRKPKRWWHGGREGPGLRALPGDAGPPGAAHLGALPPGPC